eukprot:1160552-Pelagomonas_calceolata.AAC.6
MTASKPLAQPRVPITILNLSLNCVGNNEGAAALGSAGMVCVVFASCWCTGRGGEGLKETLQRGGSAHGTHHSLASVYECCGQLLGCSSTREYGGCVRSCGVINSVM